MYRWRSDNADNTKCSSVEALREKHCSVLVGGNLNSNNKCSTRIVLLTTSPQEILSEIKEPANLGQILIAGDFNYPYVDGVNASSG